MRNCRCRNASSDAGLYARHRYLLLHHEAVLARLREIPVRDVCISVITKIGADVWGRIVPRQAQDQAALSAYIRHVAVLDFPDEAAIHYGEIRAGLKRTGGLIGANDLFIAAHARCLGLVLATNNTREFERVPGLKVENWVGKL